MKTQLTRDSERHFRQQYNVRDASSGDRKLLHGTPLMCFLHRFHSFLSSYSSLTSNNTCQFIKHETSFEKFPY